MLSGPSTVTDLVGTSIMKKDPQYTNQTLPQIDFDAPWCYSTQEETVKYRRS
jgi:hypothetical protein